MSPPSRRLNSLECLRGLAALAVVFWHLSLGFLPQVSGLFPHAVPHPLIGRWWFAVANGTAAVSFFFVLSGFVLPWRFFHTGDTGTVLRGVLKRWPRLAGPCLLATLLSWTLFRTGCYHFEEAAAVSGSPWLADFGFAGLKAAKFVPSLWDAFQQGAFETFFDGASRYDSSMWTMRAEMVGSLFVFASAPLLLCCARPAAAAFLLGVLGLMTVHTFPRLPEFLAGVFLSWYLSRRAVSLSLPLSAALVAVAFLLAGFFGPVGAYAWLAPVLPVDPAFFPVLWVPASVLLILVALGCAPVRSALSGRVARWLGRISFPVYLLHLLVLSSAGSWVYVRAAARLPGLWPALLAGAAVLAITLPAASVMSLLDRWWLRRLDRTARAFESGRERTATLRQPRLDAFRRSIHF